MALFLGRTSYGTFVYSSGAFLGETSKHFQLSLPRRDLCGMDSGKKILLFHEELQGLCLMMGYDLYYHMQLLQKNFISELTKLRLRVSPCNNSPTYIGRSGSLMVCWMFLLLACDDEKCCCYSKYTEQH